MRAFAIGLVLGCALGAGGMFFGLRFRAGPSAQTAEPISATKVESPTTTKSVRKKGKRPTKRRTGGAAVAPNPCGPIEISDAQRKQTWRGPSVALPAADVDFEAGSGSPSSLTSGQINAGIGSARTKLTECIAKARGRAEIAASIKLRFLVDAAGRVGPVRVQAPAYLHERGLLGCVRGALGSASFAATGAPTMVNLPFKLSF